MVSSQSFSRIQRRISLSPEPAAPVKRGEPLKTMPRRLPSPSFAGFIFEIMCNRKSSEPSLMRGNPGAKRPPSPRACSSFTYVSIFFHSTPKGGFESM